MEKKNGFTLIELVMVIVILGLLAAVAIPKLFNLQTNAQIAAEKGVQGGVRAGISTYYADQCANATCSYPATLDSIASGTDCSATSPCFTTVLAQGGITSDWRKTGSNTYTGPTGTTFTYNSSNGTFQ